MCDMLCNMCDMFILKKEVFHKNGFLLDPYLKQNLFLHEFPSLKDDLNISFTVVKIIITHVMLYMSK